MAWQVVATAACLSGELLRCCQPVVWVDAGAGAGAARSSASGPASAPAAAQQLEACALFQRVGRAMRAVAGSLPVEPVPVLNTLREYCKVGFSISFLGFFVLAFCFLALFLLVGWFHLFLTKLRAFCCCVFCAVLLRAVLLSCFLELFYGVFRFVLHCVVRATHFCLLLVASTKLK